MLKKRLKHIALFALISVFIISCGEEEKKNNNNNPKDSNQTINDDTPDITENASAVCLWSKLSLRETPDAKGKYKTTIYLGEKATYMGETVTDTTSKKGVEYVKLELADGTQGWADKRFLAVGADSYVLTNKTKLYKRPDILTATSKEYEKMQFVAVIETKEDWVKVKSKLSADNWFSEGWIKSEHLTDKDVDVNVAILTGRALNKDSKSDKIKALQEIIDNTDLNSSVFIPDLRVMIEDMDNEEVQDTTNYDEGYD